MSGAPAVTARSSAPSAGCAHELPAQRSRGILGCDLEIERGDAGLAPTLAPPGAAEPAGRSPAAARRRRRRRIGLGSELASVPATSQAPRAGRPRRPTSSRRRRGRPPGARAGRAGPPSRAARRRKPRPRKMSWLSWSTARSSVPSSASSRDRQSAQPVGGACRARCSARSAVRARSSRGRGEPA